LRVEWARRRSRSVSGFRRGMCSHCPPMPPVLLVNGKIVLGTDMEYLVPAHTQWGSWDSAACTCSGTGVESGTCWQGLAPPAADSRGWNRWLPYFSPAWPSLPTAALARHYTSQLKMPRLGIQARVAHQAPVGILAWAVSWLQAAPRMVGSFSRAAVEFSAPEVAALNAFHRRVSTPLVATATSLPALTPAIVAARVAARAGAGPAYQHRWLVLAESSPLAAHLVPPASVEPRRMAVSPVAPARLPCSTEVRLRPVPRNAVLDRLATVRLALAVPPTPSAQME